MMGSSNSFLQQLYQSQYERILKVAYRMVGNIELAQDLVQDVFLLALLHKDELSEHPMPDGWLMLTLKNLVQNKRREMQKHPIVPLESTETFQAAPPTLSMELYLPKGLSEAERTILLWRFEKRMEYREIADRLGISETGCRSRISRAIKHCCKLLGSK